MRSRRSFVMFFVLVLVLRAGIPRQARAQVYHQDDSPFQASSFQTSPPPPTPMHAAPCNSLVPDKSTSAITVRLSDVASDSWSSDDGGGREELHSAQGPAPLFRLPPIFSELKDGEFPSLPPHPHPMGHASLLPIEEELWRHGGAHLYEPEGDRRNWPQHNTKQHFEVLRLPEDWRAPQPLTAFQDFLGADPIHDRPSLRFAGGYSCEPRFVGHGSYCLFGFALEENGARQDVAGHQLTVDLDLRLTGTERFHVQYRPFGRENSGGSYFQFSDPEGYVNNSTGVPDRFWFEGELHSMLSGFANPFWVLDYHITIGRIPFALQNGLLMDDEFFGVVVNKNNAYLGPLSNLNMQLIYGFNDVGVFPQDGKLYGINVSADHHHRFWEASYALLKSDGSSTGRAHYFAVGHTILCGPWVVAGRTLFRWDERASVGRLFVLESNQTRVFDGQPLGIEKGVFFANVFAAADGWSSIAGGSFNRLRTTFEVNPLVQIAAGRSSDDTWGAALGVQLFRHHDDESLIPEFAFEEVTSEFVWGFGLRYLRKMGSRTYFEALSVFNYSDDPRYERTGVFLTETILF